MHQIPVRKCSDTRADVIPALKASVPSDLKNNNHDLQRPTAHGMSDKSRQVANKKCWRALKNLSPTVFTSRDADRSGLAPLSLSLPHSRSEERLGGSVVKQDGVFVVVTMGGK